MILVTSKSLICFSSILIITHCFNRPDFIEWQYRCFKRFLHDDYEYVIFNDAQDLTLEKKINEICNLLGVRSIRIPQINRVRPKDSPLTLSSWRHSQAIRFSMEQLGFSHDGIVMLIDSDMFLIKDFCVEDFLQNYDIAGIQQIRGHTYLWQGLIFFRMNNLPNKESMNFNPTCVQGIWDDTGGAMHHYFQENQTIKILFFEQKYRMFLDNDLMVYTWSSQLTRIRQYCSCSSCAKKTGCHCKHNRKILQELNFDNKILNCLELQQIPPAIEFVLNDTFFHYVASSNWDKKDDEFHKHKTFLFLKFVNSMIES